MTTFIYISSQVVLQNFTTELVIVRWPAMLRMAVCKMGICEVIV